MITDIQFEKNGAFRINGTIKIKQVNFESQTIESKPFFQVLIDKMLNVKKIICFHLADDKKVLGSERIDVIEAIDEFLTVIFAFAFILSEAKLNFNGEYKDYFNIIIQISDFFYIKGGGKLIKIPTKEIENFQPWLDQRIFNLVENIIKLFDGKSSKKKIRDELNELIYNVIVLRYKIQYV